MVMFDSSEVKLFDLVRKIACIFMTFAILSAGMASCGSLINDFELSSMEHLCGHSDACDETADIQAL